MKFFHKIGARRQKHDTSASTESSDPLLLSYSKSYDEEAPPGECEDVFELLPDDKKKKKRKSLLRKNKDKIKSPDSDDRIHAPTTDDFNPWVNRALSSEMSAQDLLTTCRLFLRPTLTIITLHHIRIPHPQNCGG